MNKLLLVLVLGAVGVGVFMVGRSAERQGNKAGSAVVAPVSQADQTAAEQNLESAAQAASAYYADNVTYAGMTTAALQRYDPAVPNVSVVSASARAFCLQASYGTAVAHLDGPNGVPSTGPC